MSNLHHVQQTVKLGCFVPLLTTPKNLRRYEGLGSPNSPVLPKRHKIHAVKVQKNCRKAQEPTGSQIAWSEDGILGFSLCLPRA